MVADSSVSGVACRMLSDLGIHELANDKPSNHSSTAPDESHLAYGVLSACVVYEGVWTLYLGRPSSIPRSLKSIVARRCNAKEATDSPWLNAWVGLCIPMAEASHVLNEHSFGDPERNSSLRKIIDDIEAWYGALPAGLVYDESRLTNMALAGFGLHTQYGKLQILLRQALSKPVNSKKRPYSGMAPSRSGSQPSADSSTSTADTYRYALRIARLVVTYREIFGMEKIPSIVLDNAVVAATTIISHLNGTDGINQATHEVMWLRQLLRSLESLQPHFPIVRRMLSSLRRMCSSSNLLAGIFPSPYRDSIDVPRELPFPGRLASRLTPGSDELGRYEALFGEEMENAWKYFQSVVLPGDLSSIGVNDFLFNLPTA